MFISLSATGRRLVLLRKSWNRFPSAPWSWLALALIGSVCVGHAQYSADFEENELQSGSFGYDEGIYLINGIPWAIGPEALRGTDSGDSKNGTAAARIRNNGSISMNDDKEGGIGTITFLYARSDFSGDRGGVAPAFVVEYSTDAGTTWTPTGSETSLDGVDTLTLYSATINTTGPVRIRIRQVSGDSGRRWNVDDINLSDFSGAPAPTLLVGGVAAALATSAGTPSVSTAVPISGSHLEGPVTATAPTGFEVSNDEISWGETAEFHPEAGEVAATVFVRLTGAEPGSFEESLSLTSPGATEVSFTVRGEVAAPPPLLTGVGVAQAYTQSFTTFISSETLPPGWSASDESYGGDWGTGTGAGLRGNAEVLGYQHTASTGVFTVTLTLVNGTGAPINELEISYRGERERISGGRSPAWEVAVADTVVPGLSYSAADEPAERSAIVEGLGIADGESFTISWSSERGDGSGSSRQIGLSQVLVIAAEEVVEIPPPAAPVFSLEAGTYFEDQLVFIDNLGDYDETVQVFYTLDGDEPSAASEVFDPLLGILVPDGSGVIRLRAIAIRSGTDPSPIAERDFNFPENVADIAAFRAGEGDVLYRITGEVTLLHRDSDRNRHFLRDNSGSLTLWDEADPTILDLNYAVGDNLSGLVGTRREVNGGSLLILEAARSPGPAVSSGNAALPRTVEPDSLSFLDTGDLVRIESVAFNESGLFAAGEPQMLTTASGTFQFRSDFVDSDYLGQAIPAGLINLTGIIGSGEGGLYITARSLADFEPVDESVAIPPLVETLPVFDITAEGGRLRGSIGSDGGSELLAAGFVLSPTNPLPQIGLEGVTAIELAPELGAFEVVRTGLASNTRYFSRAYASNAAGIRYGEPRTLITLPGQPSAPGAGAATSSGFDAVWQAAASDGGEPVTFALQVAGAGADFTDPVVFIEGIPGNTTVFPVSGLAPNAQYFYRARAINESGPSAWSLPSPAIFTLPEPIPTPQFTPESGFYFAGPVIMLANPGDFGENTEIYFTLDGSTPDNTSPRFDRSAGLAVPDTIGPVTFRAVAIEGGFSSTEFEIQFQFPVAVHDLESLRLQNADGVTVYRLLGPASVSAKTVVRNTLFIQDASGFGIQVDDPDPAVIQNEYDVGDQVSGWIGTITREDGQLLFSPLIDPGPPDSLGEPLLPVDVTLQELLARPERFQSVLIRVLNAEFEAGNRTLGGRNGSTTRFRDPSQQSFTGVLRLRFWDSNLAGLRIPDSPANLSGIVSTRGTELSVDPRSRADLSIIVPAPDDENRLIRPPLRLVGFENLSYDPVTDSTVFTIEFEGRADSHYRIDYSLNLVDWISLPSLYTGETGIFTVILVEDGDRRVEWEKLFFRASHQ